MKKRAYLATMGGELQPYQIASDAKASVAVLDTPLGPMTVEEQGGLIVRIGFGALAPPCGAILSDIEAQLAAYFAGELTCFSVPVRLEGTAFSAQVWHAAMQVPYGHTASYGAVARAIGQPRAARGVGSAMRHTPVSIRIPWHRIIGSDGRAHGTGGPIGRFLRKREGIELPDDHTATDPGGLG